MYVCVCLIYLQFIYLSSNEPVSSIMYKLLSCQSRVTVTSCFVHKVIRDLELLDHLCNTQMIYRFALAQVKCTR